jgi:two-component sensor histidine kinase
VTLSLVLHELATNAVKYGALGANEGKVEISWNVGVDAVGARRMTLLWREQGGPPVAAPARTGFGSRLIRSALAGDNGEAKIDYRAEGLRCSLSVALIETTDADPEETMSA